MSFAYGLLTMYDVKAYIGTSFDSVWSYAELADGIENVTEALNEQVQQYFFLSDNGFGKNHITGMAPAFTFTGRRIFGDAAQDYIFGKKYDLNGDRRSSFKFVWSDGSNTHSMTCDCTICSIQEFSGSANEDSAISFEIRLDGEPVVTGGPILPALTVVSVAGSSSGKTAIYVNPAAGSGNTYEYKTAATVVLPAEGVDPGAAWSVWNGSDEITATTGNQIGIVEVDAGGLAVKGGLATVTSND